MTIALFMLVSCSIKWRYWRAQQSRYGPYCLTRADYALKSGLFGNVVYVPYFPPP